MSALASKLSPCVLRPRTENSLTMHEKHAYRLIRDLFDHKEAIFGELKRASALSHTPSGGNASNAARIRAVSTDESNRRANMEARSRAIASKSRTSSPAPHANGRNHRRDRSVDPPTTRFPIQTSPTAADQRRGAARASLEVPPDNGAPTVERSVNSNNSLPAASTAIPEGFTMENNDHHPNSHTTNADHVVSMSHEDTDGVFAERRDSLGRSSRFPPRSKGKQGSLSSLNKSNVGPNRDSLGSEGGERYGVQLSDRPMDD